MNVSYITDKGIKPVNEDSYLVTPNLFGVFDGVSGLIKYVDEHGNTGGYLASQIAKEVFEKNQNEPLTTSLVEISEEITKQMKLAKIEILDKETRWATCVSVVRISESIICTDRRQPYYICKGRWVF